MEIAFVLSNNSHARVLNSANALGVKTVFFNNQDVANGEFMTNFCFKENIDWIVLAGYLRLIPSSLIEAFEGRGKSQTSFYLVVDLQITNSSTLSSVNIIN